VRAKLIGVPASHPTRAVELMLERKRIPYERVDIPNQVHKIVLPLLHYPYRTVPVLKLDGRRIQRSTAIARALDETVPDPPLFPRDPERRARVEAEEAWADGELQDCARRIMRWAAKHDRASVASVAEGARLPFPPAVVRASLPLLGPLVMATIRVDNDETRAELAALAGHLERVESLLADGVIGGDEPNAADYQVATSVRLLLLSDDLRALLAERPAGRFALRLVPDYPGRMRASFPREWLAPLQPR